MYGKYFAQTYTGSMVGSGSPVFAVWGYIIANMRMDDWSIELNPIILSTIIGDPVPVIEKAIEFLCAPDTRSRTKDCEGRRLIREGEFLYRVVNAQKYSAIKTEIARREYQKVYMRSYRKRGKDGVNTNEANVSLTVNDCNQFVNQVEEDVDVEEKEECADGALFANNREQSKKEKALNDDKSKSSKKQRGRPKAPPAWVFWSKKPEELWIDAVRIYKKAVAVPSGKDTAILRRVACLYCEVEFRYMLKAYGKESGGSGKVMNPGNFEYSRDEWNSKMFQLPDYDEAKLLASREEFRAKKENPQKDGANDDDSRPSGGNQGTTGPSGGISGGMRDDQST